MVVLISVILLTKVHILSNKLNATLFLTGILAIAKPCSVVVDIKELYGSGSKSQVYAHLHELLSKDEMTAIGMEIYHLLLTMGIFISIWPKHLM